MRTLLPENKVNVPYRSVLKELVERIHLIASAEVVSIFITGSYARGDAEDSSDFDLWIILDVISFDILNEIGESILKLTQSYDVIINPQCLSREELQKKHFRNWSEASVKILDAVILSGENVFDEIASITELEEIYKSYLADIMMGIRHYITVDKPKSKLTYNRLETYILKPLLFPLRMERYCKTGIYPIRKIDLFHSYTGKMKEVIEYSLDKNKLDKAIEKDHKFVLREMYEAVNELISSS